MRWLIDYLVSKWILNDDPYTLRMTELFIEKIQGFIEIGWFRFTIIVIVMEFRDVQYLFSNIIHWTNNIPTRNFAFTRNPKMHNAQNYKANFNEKLRQTQYKLLS
jgi:hypothetical protein